MSTQLMTDRLLLRMPTMDDWPSYETMMSSDRSVYMGGPYASNQAWGLFCHDVAQWQLLGHGAFMLEHRIDARCLGQVSINHGPLFPEKEIGWLVYPGAEGNGFAYEAARRVLQWAFDDQGFTSLVSYIDPRNQRSIVLAERLGAVIDEKAVKSDPEDLVYRHSACPKA